jgi:hypothetical protein
MRFVYSIGSAHTDEIEDSQKSGDNPVITLLMVYFTATL